MVQMEHLGVIYTTSGLQCRHVLFHCYFNAPFCLFGAMSCTTEASLVRDMYLRYI